MPTASVVATLTAGDADPRKPLALSRAVAHAIRQIGVYEDAVDFLYDVRVE